MNTLTIQQIQEILPHRYPFLLIDRVLDYEPGQWARARKCVTADEPFFTGHFPNQPIMPGVLILEALAQTGAIAVLSEPENKGKIALFGGVKNARFKTPVIPGDALELECHITKRKGPVGFGEATASVDGKIACKAELSFVVQP
jgi:3-hydroxyacyl-[acyl-carrier-protein] dehydratase